MKKLISFLLLLCVLAIAAVYYFIPQTFVVGKTVKINCVSYAAFRSLSDDNTWHNWWPVQTGKSTVSDSFMLSNNRYLLIKKNENNIAISIENSKEVLYSEMNILTMPKDSALINWHCEVSAGNSPFARIAAYRKALLLKTDMTTILNHIQDYLSDFKNVYGFTPIQASTKDTLLIAAKSISAIWPGTDFIYGLVHKLKDFCVSTKGCAITGTPMLNISPLYKSGYQVMVAVPVNRMMPEKDSFYIKRMIPGKFMTAEVIGGAQTVARIHQQIAFYFQDYKKVSMAIPFDYLVTDREKEKDTSKWITKIYAPVY